MPIYLPAPKPDPRGPDGQGWNRLSLGAHYSTIPGQCALRPRTFATLYETLRTTELARFGNHGRCVRDNPGRYPDCRSCPVLTAEPSTLDTTHDRVLVRIQRHTTGSWLATQTVDVPYIVTDPDLGWNSPHQRWAWDQLARLTGWRAGRVHDDRHSPGFWLERIRSS